MKTILEKPFLRYLIVGGTAFIVEYVSFIILYAIFESWLVVDNGLSFGLGLATSFLLNRIWVFKTSEKKYGKQAGHQLLIYVCLAIINLLLTLALVSYFKQHDIDPKIGKLLAMVITSVWNFFIYKVLIFNHITPKE